MGSGTSSRPLQAHHHLVHHLFHHPGNHHHLEKEETAWKVMKEMPARWKSQALQAPFRT